MQSDRLEAVMQRPAQWFYGALRMHKMKPPIKVACLGAGYFSRFHYDAWRRIDDVQLVGSADIGVDRAVSTGLPAFASLESLLQSVVPDVLDIITGASSHLDAIGTAVRAGVKTIICQKPFCNSRDEAYAAIALADEAGVLLIVHENTRFQPWYRCMAEAKRDGLLGTEHQFVFRLRTGDGQGADAYPERLPFSRGVSRLLVHETGVQFIDVFLYLFGMPDAVYADLRQINPGTAGKDAGFFIFDYGYGFRAMLDGNRYLDHAAANPRLTMGEALFEGDRGTLSLTGDGVVKYRRFGSTEMKVLLPSMGWPSYGGDCVLALQQHVVAGLLTGSIIENQARDYAVVLELEEAIYRAAAEHRKQDVTSIVRPRSIHFTDAASG